MITVLKFGGTSVGSPEALKRVAGIIAGTEGDRIVVASAMSGITNFLVSLVDDPSRDMGEAREKFVNKHFSADRKSTRLNSSHIATSRMPSSA